ncbi:unnamed protein product [Prorocentrum cordatum]|uniref:SGNH hydrolase-type esterase domain-containing protein n=1 Tax=Prorocentrum cordatum TaxID=2364126 RepID=A0ABN9SXA7_9DINO|nr:unnamed protein product [Polarella glacialis]|mmetsp:Transcript_94597/g.253879  ORF Transcript_94597/g.253879 Transcript_94597/m.253879 type:complete len:267 (-) Transcript_94597:12-812(-)
MMVAAWRSSAGPPGRGLRRCLLHLSVVAAVCVLPFQAAAVRAPVRIACIGDSITAGFALQNRSLAYPGRLEGLLRQRSSSEIEVVNLGVPGRPLMKHGCQDSALEKAHRSSKEPDVDPRADVVMVMLGTNDAHGEGEWPCSKPFQEQYTRLIESLAQAPSKPRVYVLTPPPVTSPPDCPDCPPFGGISRRVVNEVYPKLLRTVCDRSSSLASFVDVWSRLGGSGMAASMTLDGVHPKEEAHLDIARSLVDVLCADLDICGRSSRER